MMLNATFLRLDEDGTNAVLAGVTRVSDVDDVRKSQTVETGTTTVI